MSFSQRYREFFGVGVLLLVLLFPISAGAYEGHESELWTEAGFRYRLNKKVAMDWRAYWRFRGPVDTTKSNMGQFGLRYRLSKRYSLTVGYRHISKLKDDERELAHRFYSSFSARKNWKPFSFSYRLRFQREGESGGGESNYEIRNRLKARWALGKSIRPFISSDLIAAEDKGGWDMDALRMSAGFELPLGPHELALGYRQVYPLRQSDDPLKHIVLSAYSYQW